MEDWILRKINCSFWKQMNSPNSWNISYQLKCIFCDSIGEYHYFAGNIVSCEQFLNSIFNNEFKLDCPQTQLDNKIYDLIVNWIYREFNYFSIEHYLNIECSLCKKSIEVSSTILTTKFEGKQGFIHYDCLNKGGFKNFYTIQDCKKIITTYIIPFIPKETNLVNTNPKFVTSNFDKIKITTCLDNNDFPIYSQYYEELNELTENIFDNWEESTTDSKCIFCGDDDGTLFNREYNLYSCQSCLFQLEDREFDIVNPDNHGVSMRLRNIALNIIRSGYYNFINYKESGMQHNKCYFCDLEISSNEEDNVAVSKYENICVIAHSNCVPKYGFVELYSNENFDDILETVQELFMDT